MLDENLKCVETDEIIEEKREFAYVVEIDFYHDFIYKLKKAKRDGSISEHNYNFTSQQRLEKIK